jgi:hypothetical protein
MQQLWPRRHEVTEQRGEASMLKRSGWITGAIVAQFLWALALLATSVYLLVLTRSSAIRNEADAAEAISGLKIAASLIFAPAVVSLLSWFGLWKEKLWGWWMALVGNLLLLGMLAYAMIDDGWHNIDWDLAGMTTGSAIVPIFLLLPAVRRFYWKDSEP